MTNSTNDLFFRSQIVFEKKKRKKEKKTDLKDY